MTASGQRVALELERSRSRGIARRERILSAYAVRSAVWMRSSTWSRPRPSRRALLGLGATGRARRPVACAAATGGRAVASRARAPAPAARGATRCRRRRARLRRSGGGGFDDACEPPDVLLVRRAVHRAGARRRGISRCRYSLAVAGTGLAWSAVSCGRPQRRARRHAERGAVVLGRDRSGRAVTVDQPSTRGTRADRRCYRAPARRRRFRRSSLSRSPGGRPVVAIDMKGSPGFAAQLQASADAAGPRPARVPHPRDRLTTTRWRTAARPRSRTC